MERHMRSYRDAEEGVNQAVWTLMMK